MADLDTLRLKVEADAANASSGIQQIIGSLSALKEVVQPAVSSMQTLRNELQGLSRVVNKGFNTEKMRESLTSLATAFQQIRQDDIARLSYAGQAIQELSTSMATITSTGIADMGNVATTIQAIGTSLQSVDPGSLTVLENLSYTMGTLATNLTNMNENFDGTFGTGLQDAMLNVAHALQQVSEDDITRLRTTDQLLGSMTTTIAGMSSIDPNNVENVRKFLDGIIAGARSITDDDIQRIRDLGSAVNVLYNTISGVTQSDFASAVQSMFGPAAQAANALNSKLSGVGKNAGMKLSGIFGGMAKGAISSVKGISDAVFGLGKRSEHASTGLGKFVTALGRIATYRFLRTLIKNITSGASEGLQNLAHASSEANATLSQLSSASLTMKNAMGGALYSAIAPLVPLLTTIANAAVYAMNAISQLFAILGGRATYMRATTATQNYAKALHSAAGGAAALKQELMGFDEINSLTPDSGGGGGGGGSGVPDYAAMFDETPVSETIKEMVELADFSGLGKIIARKVNAALSELDWNSIRSKAQKVVSSFTSFFVGLFGGEGGLDGALIGQTIANAINTGTELVNQFWDEMPWMDMGVTAHDMLMNALNTIDPQKIGLALTGKLRSALIFFRLMLPQNKAEWTKLGTAIGTTLSAAIQSIPAEFAGQIIGDVILGGFTAVKAITDEEVLTQLAGKIKAGIDAAISKLSTPASQNEIGGAIAGVINDALGAITTLAGGTRGNILTAVVGTLNEAISQISPSQLEDAKDSVLGALRSVLSAAMSLTIDINGIEFSAAGLLVSLPAVFAALKPALGVISKTLGLGTGGGLSFVAAIPFFLTATFSIIDFVADLAHGGDLGEKAVRDELSSVISNIMSGIGLTMMTKNPMGGLGMFAASMFIQPTIEGIANIVSNVKSGTFSWSEFFITLGDILKVVGGIAMTFNPKLGIALMGIGFIIKPVVEKIESIASDIKENGVNWENITDILSLVVKAFGTALLFFGHPVAGAIVLGIGFAIKPIVTRVMEAFFTDDPAKIQKMIQENLNPNEEVYIGDVKIAFSAENIRNIEDDLNLELNEYALQDYSVALSQMVGNAISWAESVEDMKLIFESISGLQFSSLDDFVAFLGSVSGTEDLTSLSTDVYALGDAMFTLFDSYKEQLGSEGAQNMQAFFGAIIQEAGLAYTGLESVGEAVTAANDAAAELDVSTAATSAKNLATELSNSASEMSSLSDGTEDATAASDLNAIKAAASGSTEALKGTGEEIDNIYTKYVEIPSDVVFNITFSNYDDIMKKLTNLKTAIANISGGDIKLKVRAGLTAESKKFLEKLATLDGNMKSNINALIAASAFAGGGYPQAGQLYIANENGVGSELIGQIGNRHAVANDEQIGDAIFRYMDEHDQQSGGGIDYAAMASAIVSAAKSAGLGAVYLDGKMLANSINRESQRSGRPAINF